MKHILAMVVLLTALSGCSEQVALEDLQDRAEYLLCGRYEAGRESIQAMLTSDIDLWQSALRRQLALEQTMVREFGDSSLWPPDVRRSALEYASALEQNIPTIVLMKEHVDNALTAGEALEAMTQDGRFEFADSEVRASLETELRVALGLPLESASSCG